MEIDLDTEHVYPYTPSLINAIEFHELGVLTELKNWKYINFINISLKYLQHNLSSVIVYIK